MTDSACAAVSWTTSSDGAAIAWPSGARFFAALSVFASAFRERAAPGGRLPRRGVDATQPRCAPRRVADHARPGLGGSGDLPDAAPGQAVARDLLAERDDAATIHRRHAGSSSFAPPRPPRPNSRVQSRAFSFGFSMRSPKTWMRRWCGRWLTGRPTSRCGLRRRCGSGVTCAGAMPRVGPGPPKRWRWTRDAVRGRIAGICGRRPRCCRGYGVSSVRLRDRVRQSRGGGNPLPRLRQRRREAWLSAGFGSIARERGDYHAALERHTQTRALFERAGDAAGVCRQLNAITLAQWLSGDTQGAGGSARAASAAFAPVRAAASPRWAAINGGVVARPRGEPPGPTFCWGALDLSQDQASRRDRLVPNQRGVVARLRGEEERAMRMRRRLCSSIGGSAIGGDRRAPSRNSRSWLPSPTTRNVPHAAPGGRDDISPGDRRPVPPAEADAPARRRCWVGEPRISPRLLPATVLLIPGLRPLGGDLDGPGTPRPRCRQGAQDPGVPARGSRRPRPLPWPLYPERHTDSSFAGAPRRCLDSTVCRRPPPLLIRASSLRDVPSRHRSSDRIRRPARAAAVHGPGGQGRRDHREDADRRADRRRAMEAAAAIIAPGVTTDACSTTSRIITSATTGLSVAPVIAAFRSRSAPPSTR